MAYAGPAGEESDLRKRVPQVDHEGRRALRPVRDLERSILRRIYSVGGCGCLPALRSAFGKRLAPTAHSSPPGPPRLPFFLCVVAGLPPSPLACGCAPDT